jgi:SagB-type dehydrogenase family enzyme
MTQTPLTIQSYHQRTKHQLERYARGPETLDWDCQPDPFRRFEGSRKLPLPLAGEDDTAPYSTLYEPGAIEARPLDRQHIGLLLELSMGLSAWKSFGPDRWSLRINPSSGNLHPTECYLLLPDGEGIEAGLYHYHSYGHELEQRCQADAETLSTALGEGFVVGLSSIHKRESWKYGERAYRYCQHDVGHAMAAIRYASALLGWHLQLLDECGDEQVAGLLGLDREGDFEGAEAETPDLLLHIRTGETGPARVDIDALLPALAGGNWSGHANRLTDDNFYKWPVIPQAEAAARKPSGEAGNYTPPQGEALSPPATDQTAAAIIRQRRSAQAFDGGSLALESFDRMLQCLTPRPGVPPLDLLPWAPRLQLVLFVHRVEGLTPGLYALPRSDHGAELMRGEFRDDMLWEPVTELRVPLYRLVSASTTNAARAVACHQPIASDSAFSLAMLAEYQASLEGAPWRYRQLHWEAGAIGQALYLEAEAAGVRGTGIGCFFDDAVHELLGIQETRLQDIYHFTVGTPRVDSRLQSEPPYAHLGNG